MDLTKEPMSEREADMLGDAVKGICVNAIRHGEEVTKISVERGAVPQQKFLVLAHFRKGMFIVGSTSEWIPRLPDEKEL